MLNVPNNALQKFNIVTDCSLESDSQSCTQQHAKKDVYNKLGLVDFVVGPVDSILCRVEN